MQIILYLTFGFLTGFIIAYLMTGKGTCAIPKGGIDFPFEAGGIMVLLLYLAPLYGLELGNIPQTSPLFAIARGVLQSVIPALLVGWVGRCHRWIRNPRIIAGIYTALAIFSAFHFKPEMLNSTYMMPCLFGICFTGAVQLRAWFFMLGIVMYIGFYWLLLERPVEEPRKTKEK